MEQIKIAFFDIDGTLIDMEKKVITERTLEALRRLKERGVLLCLATGRGPLTLPHFDGVEFDAFLTFNGSYCFDREGTIYSNPLPREDVKTIVQNAASIHRPVSLATKDRMLANGKDEDLIEYYSFAKREVEVSDDFEEAMEDEVYQIMLGCRRADYPLLLQGTRRARITAWWDRAVDIIPADGGKGEAIRRILSFYHLDRSSALAFGDGDNDIEMLQAVDYGVAMGNASEGLKAVARDICASVSRDGVYHYCLDHGLL